MAAIHETKPSDFACLDKLQRQLQSIYEIDIPFTVSDFVTTDLQLISGLTGGHKDHLREKLLVLQDGEDLDLSLYLHEDVITTLIEETGDNRLGPENFDNLCLAIEGISHFLYLTWRALQKHSVSQLELELQAEVDKYIFALTLISQQKQFELVDQLREILFENIRFDEALNSDELFRYREANHYAARYCYFLEGLYRKTSGSKHMNSELREFYRLGRQDKFRRIENQLL